MSTLRLAGRVDDAVNRETTKNRTPVAVTSACGIATRVSLTCILQNRRVQNATLKDQT